MWYLRPFPLRAYALFAWPGSWWPSPSVPGGGWRAEPSLREAERVERAQHRVMTACKRRFGFSFEPFTERDPVALENGDKPNYDRLYGVFDEAHAATYGYHPGVPLMSEESGKELTQPDTEYSSEWRNVAGAELGGGTYRGQQIPAGGCFSEARRAVAAGGPAFDPLINEAIMAEVYPLVNADSRVRAADAAWGDCMANAGYDYRTPLEANDDNRWWRSDRPTETEIAVAVTDVRCKKETNLVGINMAVRSAYLLRAMPAHAQELEATKEGHRRQLRNATQILAAQ